jgi:heme/copper-type cytochrome/quinol oxidase subunit 2
MTELPLCGNNALIVLWTGSAITAAIFAVMVYSIVSCKSAVTSQAAFVHRTSVEVVWAIIPILILIVTAMPAVKPVIDDSKY